MLAGTTTHQVHADTWQPNSVQQIEQQMKAQTKQGQKLVVYVVQRGDTLTGISIASKVPMKTIIDLNHITNANVLRVGEKINLGDSQSARAFVESKGQSVAENVKGYQAPKANKQNTTYQTNMGVANKGTVANNHYTPVVNNGSHVVNNGTVNNGPHATVNNAGHVTSNNAQHVANNGNHVANNGSHATVNGNHQTTGSQVTPSKPATGGNQGTTTTPSKPNTGNQGNTNPSRPTKPVAPATEQLSAQKVNQTFQNTMSTKYGWNGTWVSEEEGDDGYQCVDPDQRSAGYAEGVTWAGDKNPNKTLGEGEAKAMHDKWASDGDNYNDYKYGYSKTTVHKNDKGQSVAHTDYYLYNK